MIHFNKFIHEILLQWVTYENLLLDGKHILVKKMIAFRNLDLTKIA